MSVPSTSSDLLDRERQTPWEGPARSAHELKTEGAPGVLGAGECVELREGASHKTEQKRVTSPFLPHSQVQAGGDELTLRAQPPDPAKVSRKCRKWGEEEAGGKRHQAGRRGG